MKQKTYIISSGLLFATVAFVHLLRVVNGWDIVISGWSLPMWVSWLAVIGVGYLVWGSYKLSR
ncbi:MAG: hypothetical protein WD883_02555 [Candidatus Colwellbacteria bacterium]